ncbi:hypothetical protein KDK_21120 [Dictyobacter kobayashii]|uniref:Uncharacterized protein n=1 Tax=Dictyobacter kobayashii TaxID=2014872 RepID=A0A402AGT7_9CHLR|nr:hypothetical protein KDK_21120 [Dictyobacter kobayashii]
MTIFPIFIIQPLGDAEKKQIASNAHIPARDITLYTTKQYTELCEPDRQERTERSTVIPRK